MKRLLVISDSHTGSLTGLTPPKWQTNDLHKKCWTNYTEILAKLKPIDILIANGDLINGSRAGDADVLTADINEQQEMAAEIIDTVDANSIFITSGTDAHTGFDGAALELERQIVDKIKVRAMNRQKIYKPDDIKYDILYNINVENVRINSRHYTGPKGMFAGRAATGSADAAWNAIRAALDGEKLANIIIRSHVHYFNQYDNLYQFVVTTPGLQLPGSRYALKKCSGIVHWGVVYFDLEDGHFTFGKEIRKIEGTETPEYVV
jgi:hypothetical protein